MYFGISGLKMALSRRQFLAGSSSVALATTAGCAGPFGSQKSYITDIVEPANLSVVFQWTDVALQALRD